MATITEDYVSFDLAKLLKEKGFDEPCHCFYEYRKRLYNDMDKYFPDGMKNSDHDKEGNKGVSAPTLQMAMKWLREVHNLSVEVYRTACGYIGCIVAIPSGTDIKFLEEDGDDLPSGTYTKYEYACNAAIKYCLEKLENRNKQIDEL